MVFPALPAWEAHSPLLRLHAPHRSHVQNGKALRTGASKAALFNAPAPWKNQRKKLPPRQAESAVITISLNAILIRA